MQGISQEKVIHPKVDFIVLNDTRKPTTGGDYVYAVMKDELVKQGYSISEMSVPCLVKHMTPQVPKSYAGRVLSLSAEALAYLGCYVYSLREFSRRSRLIITSSCPTFPVFGHLTYHQPKAGVCTDFIRQGGNTLKRKIGYRIQENESLSPLWQMEKRLITLHLSNSIFTQKLVKEIYGLDSSLLYPPVPVAKYLARDLHSKRKPYVYVTRPQAITGISTLPEIVKLLPRNIKIIMTGRLDEAGKRVLRILKSLGKDFEYLGFVEEQVKIEILGRSSVFINLAANETFGITVVEALAAGCIPLAHNSGAIPEFLPSVLLFSSVKECAEKIVMQIDRDGTFREQLRSISLKFDEPIFRRNFMLFVRQTESHLKLEPEDKTPLSSTAASQVN